MTAGEIAVLAPLAVSSLGSMLALFKLVMNGKAKKNSVPPPNMPDCQPCSDSVDRLCSAVEKWGEKQDRVLLSIEKFIAKEEGRRDALARTGEHPMVG